MLDEHFKPGPALKIKVEPITLRLGEMIEIYPAPGGQRD
jgi:hypothetical protein